MTTGHAGLNTSPMLVSDDILMIEKSQQGDRSSFGELIQLYQDRIYTLCRYLLENPEDANDAAQDTFVKAFIGIKDYTPTASFYTWLYRIAVNTCLDHKRKFSLRAFFFPSDSNSIVDDFPSQFPSPEAALATKQSLQVFQTALNRLSPKLRTVIVLKELEGLSYEEIAEVLDVSVGTVKSRISRAREELQLMTKKITEQKRQ